MILPLMLVRGCMVAPLPDPEPLSDRGEDVKSAVVSKIMNK